MTAQRKCVSSGEEKVYVRIIRKKRERQQVTYGESKTDRDRESKRENKTIFLRQRNAGKHLSFVFSFVS